MSARFVMGLFASSDRVVEFDRDVGFGLGVEERSKHDRPPCRLWEKVLRMVIIA